MNIREAHTGDLDTLTAFQVAMALETENYHLPEAQVREGIKALLEDPSRGRYYVIEEEERLCACTMTTYEWSDWRNAWVLWIQSVYVHPEFRRRGLYSQLYEHVKTRVAERADFAGIRLYVDQSNKAAIATYRNLGMTDEHYTLYEYMPED